MGSLDVREVVASILLVSLCSDAASSGTSRDESQDSDISEPEGHGETFMRAAQLRAAQHARDCREAIHTLSQLSVIITNEAEAAAQLQTGGSRAAPRHA